MMDHLIMLAEQLRPELQSRLQVFGKYWVRGALLEVDRFWLEAYLVQLKIRPSESWESWNLGEFLQHESCVTPIKWDFTFVPEGWDEHSKAMGYGEGKSPILIRVILREQGLPGAMDWPRELAGHPITYEYRPPVVATSGLSVLARRLRKILARQDDVPTNAFAKSIGRGEPPTAGTLGGYVRGIGNGATYLISCHHVLGPAGTTVYAPGPYEGRASSPVATVVYDQFPPPSPPGLDCNFFGMPNAMQLDVSVAILHDNAGARDLIPEKTVDGIRNPARMIPYQPVLFVGKESGRVEAQLSGVTMWHELYFPEPGDKYIPRCFGTIFEMSDRRGDQVDTLAQPGDSGSWIVDEIGDMRQWNGMLVGRLGRRAYGCYAHLILQACQNAVGFPGGVALL
jgi:hypothetical protein